MNFKKTTLSNGLSVITIPMKGNPAVMVLAMVETGSNYETKAQNGLSHFLEHMCFKGTERRKKAGDISLELDSLGAQNNAFTSNEYTGYYAKAAKKHFSKVFDIISDLYLNPTLPAEDLEKERGVILQEISMYEDLPQRKVWDVLGGLMYGDTPAGRTILGPSENIKKFTREDFLKYRRDHYVAGKTYIVVAGDVTEKSVMAEVNKHFKNIPVKAKLGKVRVKESQKLPAFRLHYKKTDQAHMVLAFRTYGANDKRVVKAELLAEILGKGMSSRLFTKLRDEMGACYYVRAGLDSYTDHGMFAISTGINASRADEVLKTLIAECKKLSTTLVSKSELDKAKEHYSGNLYMGLETADSLAEFYAGQEVATHKLKTPQEIEKEIRKITPEDIRKIAKEIFKDNNLNLAIVGDIKDEKSLLRSLSFK